MNRVYPNAKDQVEGEGPGGVAARTLTLNLTPSVSYVGDVQVIEFDWREKSPGLIRAVLTVVIPAGSLEAA